MSSSSAARAILAIGGLALPIAAGLAALALGMDSNWDLRNYHWYNGWAVLAGRLGKDAVVAQVPSWYSPALDIPLYLLGTNVSARMAAFVLGAIAGLNGTVLMLLAHATVRLGSPLRRALTAVGLGAAGLGGACAISVLGTAFNDYVLSLGSLAALFVMARKVEAIGHGPRLSACAWMALAGFLVGAMVGLKQTAAIHAFGLGVAALFLPTTFRRRIEAATALTLAAIAGFALVAGPWMLYLWQDTGNPFFPFFNHIFRSPLMPAVSFRDTHFIPYGQALDWLFFPFWMLADHYRTMEVAFFDLRLGFAMLAMPLGLAGLAWRRLRMADGGSLSGGPVAPAEARVVLVAGFATYVAWVLFFCIYRYALGLEMLAPLLVVAGLGVAPGPVRLRLGLAAVLVLVAIVTVQPGDWGRKPWTDRWIEVTVPPIPDADRAMVLMTGYEPTSFVVPSFPTAPRYIRIHSNFTGPGQAGFGINDRMRAIVEAHRGPFYVLFQLARDRRTEEALATFGLVLDRATCTHVPTSLEDDPIVFCPVSRG